MTKERVRKLGDETTDFIQSNEKKGEKFNRI